MTAIDKYLRLESIGLLREGDGEAREVLVSFGDATLVLSRFDETPLAHWALVAIRRESGAGSVAIYSPDTEGYERLEISDPDMIEAIALVSRIRKTIHRPRWRWRVGVVLLVGVLAFGAYFVPMALRGQAARVTTQASARELGRAMILKLGLKVCQDGQADSALRTLENGIFANDHYRILVTRSGPDGTVFPGGLIVVSNAALRSFGNSRHLADWAALLSRKPAPLDNLFARTSPSNLLTYIATGKFPDGALEVAARTVVADTATALSTSEIPVSRRVLNDQDWAKLRKICQE